MVRHIRGRRITLRTLRSNSSSNDSPLEVNCLNNITRVTILVPHQKLPHPILTGRGSYNSRPSDRATRFLSASYFMSTKVCTILPQANRYAIIRANSSLLGNRTDDEEPSKASTYGYPASEISKRTAKNKPPQHDASCFPRTPAPAGRSAT